MTIRFCSKRPGSLKGHQIQLHPPNLSTVPSFAEAFFTDNRAMDRAAMISWLGQC